MDLGTLLTVLGIIATITLGTLGIYVVIKRKYPGQVTFFRESSLPLFDSIVKNMPELEVLYQKNSVSERLVLLKGLFLNTGSKDINESMVEEKICVNLPDGFRWLTAKVVSSSPKVTAEVYTEPQKLIFQSGLFRCKEFIRFEALAEIPAKTDEESGKSIGKKLEDSIEITHRISDTQKIKNRELIDMTTTSKYMKGFFALLLTIVLMICVIAGVTFFKGWPSKITYIIEKDGANIEVNIKPRADGTVKISQVNGDYEEIKAVDVFFRNQNLKPNIVPDKTGYKFIVAVIIAYLALLLVLILLLYLTRRKATKLQRMISEAEIG